METDQAVTGVEEHDANANNVLEEIPKTEQNGNTRPEPCNNSNNNNIQKEITGVTENNTVPILEEEKDPN